MADIGGLKSSRTAVIGHPVEKDPFSAAAAFRLNRSSRIGRESQRQTLGAGYVTLPPLPSMEPMSKLMADPAASGETPGLAPGMCIADQYEIRGVLAHGGSGWIYLAWDRVLSRWVVLKGLLRTSDEESLNRALAERKFLASVKHPNIVSVYNFVRFGGAGFIVMEYVGGKTLKTIRSERGPLPVAEAIAYIHRILNAVAYLHRQRILFCDFKLENCMLEEDDVKLIDLGCVRQVDDKVSAIYGTIGYSAPDAAEDPTISSDLYTVGRSLAILVSGFDLFGEYVSTLPGPAAVPVFGSHPALYAFLSKATQRNPSLRFQSAEEMAGQLLGVLREVTAGTVPPRLVESVFFSSVEQFNPVQSEAGVMTEPHRLLPSLTPDAGDNAAVALASANVVDGEARLEALQRIAETFHESVDAPVRIAELYLEREDFTSVDRFLDMARTRDPFEWRVEWLRGKAALARKRPAEALAPLEAVAAHLPGELTPRFALAVAAEAAGDWQAASRWYDVVAVVDPSNVVAALGCARCLCRLHDTEAAVAAYQRVLPTSNAYQFAQLALVRAVLHSPDKRPGLAELLFVSTTLEPLRLESSTFHDIRSECFAAAIEALDAERVEPTSSLKFLGTPLEAGKLRLAAESALRALARVTASRHQRMALVQRANTMRPFTWI